MTIQNTHLREVHLTDEQFAELLMGAKPAAVQDHLKVCAECAGEAERVAGAIGSFARESRLWAERRATVSPSLVTGSGPSFVWVSILARPQAWTAAALAIALGVGVAISTHHPQQEQQAVVGRQPPMQMQSVAQAGETKEAVTPKPAAVAPHAVRMTPSKLKADNRLLSAIDGELRADVAPENLYGLNAGSHAVRSSGRMTD